MSERTGLSITIPTKYEQTAAISTSLTTTSTVATKISAITATSKGGVE